MRKLCILFLFCFSVSMLHSQTPTTTTKPASINTNNLECSKFRWGKNDQTDKAAILVTVTINNKNYWYQLDTGADVFMSYGPTMPAGGSVIDGNTIRIPNVLFAGKNLGNERAYQAKEMPESKDPEDPHGTVGLEALLGRVLILDFPAQRVCLLDQGDVPKEFQLTADWVNAQINHGSFYVEMKLNDKKLEGIQYDTGSSGSSLDVDLLPWKEYTGIESVEKAPTHTKVCCAWGKPIEFVGAPATGDLQIGKHLFAKPQITTEPDQPDSFSKNSWGHGLMGNALFLKGIVLLDLGAHPRFGYLEAIPSAQ